MSDTGGHYTVGREGTLRTRKYQGIDDGGLVRGVRVSERNFQAVANWAGGTAISKETSDGNRVHQRVKIDGLVAQLGDFVLKDDAGEYFRVKAKDFERLYNLVV